MIPKREYREAIDALELAMTQLQPDGRCCVVCGDTGHQAWECHHNPLVMANRGYKLEYQWRCFHCNLVFIDAKKAEEHFGKRCTDREYPVCVEA
jgi:hypothetical protein